MQANKLIAGFKKGPPDNLEFMEIMYEDAHVDGTSAVMPGVPREIPADLVEKFLMLVALDIPHKM